MNRFVKVHDKGRPEATARGVRVWGDDGLICDVEIPEADQLGLAVAILQKYLERRALRQSETGDSNGAVYRSP